MATKPKQTKENVAPSEELLTAVEGDENTNVTPVEPEAPLVEEPAVPSKASSEGSEIAAAIAQGMKEAKSDKTIKITSDKSVISRFSPVKNKKTGEVMLRENATGVLSKVQLESLEEKEASLQGEEVEEVRQKK